MANTLFTEGRKLLLNGSVDWDGATPYKAVMVNTSGTNAWTPDMAIANMASIASNSFRTSAVEITNRAITSDGAADGDDVTFTAVASSADPIEALIIYKEGNNAAISDAANIPLVYIDSASGLSITPNGGNIIVVWDGGVNRIFRP